MNVKAGFFSLFFFLCPPPKTCHFGGLNFGGHYKELWCKKERKEGEEGNSIPQVQYTKIGTSDVGWGVAWLLGWPKNFGLLLLISVISEFSRLPWKKEEKNWRRKRGAKLQTSEQVFFEKNYSNFLLNVISFLASR